MRQPEFIDERGNFIVKLYKHGNDSEKEKEEKIKVEKGIIKMSIPNKPTSSKQLFYCDSK